MKFMDIEVVSHPAGFRVGHSAKTWVVSMRRRKFKLTKIHLHPALIQYLLTGRIGYELKGLLSHEGEQ